MPKIVDPAQRREAIADALFTIVLRQGLSRVSLRTIADETGLAIGSIRHYFSTADGIVRFALDTLVERITARLEGHLSSLLPEHEAGHSSDQAKAKTVEFLAELLPLDETRRKESVVWLAFEEEARTNPDLADVFATAVVGTRQLMLRMIEGMARRGALRSDADIELEADTLASLLDGLTLRSTLHPEVLTPERAKDIIAAHLDGLRRDRA